MWALKIKFFDGNKIEPEDERYAPFMAQPGWKDRFKGSSADYGYYVVYEDGYASWSPSAAFESGYTLVK